MYRNIKDILSVSFIILFIAGQALLIKRIFSTFEENIKLKYSGLAHEAINSLNYTTEHQGLDNVIESFDTLSAKYLIALATVPSDLENWIKQEARKEFMQLLGPNEEISNALKKYYSEHNLKDGFTHHISIETLVLQPYEQTSFTIFPDSVNDSTEYKGMNVNTFLYESDKYKLKIATYIKLEDKYRLIIRESSTILTISILCISIVLFFYLVTLFNLRKEKRLSTMKTDFMNNLMHELKTPLATISIAGKNLEMEEVQDNRESIKSIASTIKRQNIHLNKLVNHIVDVSMWEKEQFQIEKTEVNLEVFLAGIVDGFKKGCSKNITIRENYEDRMPYAHIDILHFTTLLNNLLSNAVKYNSDKKEIKVNAEFNGKHIVSVSDNGIGISSHDQKLLFNKFFRAGNGNIHKTKGLGLGLYFAKKIVDAHNGEIRVESKPGAGSKFTITF